MSDAPYATWRHIRDLRDKAHHHQDLANHHEQKALRLQQAADELERIINGND